MLDAWRKRIEGWLGSNRRLSAQRARNLLEQEGAGGFGERTVRQYVSPLRRELFPKEAFVHRTHEAGETMEVDFAESLAVVGDRRHKVKYRVATLPASNACFARGGPTGWSAWSACSMASGADTKVFHQELLSVW